MFRENNAIKPYRRFNVICKKKKKKKKKKNIIIIIIRTATDSVFYIFRENKDWYFTWIVAWQTIQIKCQVLFSQNNNYNINRISSAKIFERSYMFKVKTFGLKPEENSVDPDQPLWEWIQLVQGR